MTRWSKAGRNRIFGSTPIAVAVGIAVVVNLAYSYSLLFIARPESGYTTLWEGWMQPLATLVPGIIAAMRAVNDRRDRTAWALVSVGLLLNTIATLIFVFVEANKTPLPSPAPSDFFFIATYFAIGGGLLLIGHGDRRTPRSHRLDALIVGAAIGSGVVALWFEPILHVSGNTAQTIVGLAYPGMDVALLMILASVVLPGRHRPAPAVMFFSVAALLWAFGDIVYMRQLAAGTYRLGTSLELTWGTGTTLIGVAAGLAGRPVRPRAAKGDDALVPVLFAMSTLIIVTLGLVDRVPPLASWLGVVAVAAALARVTFTVRELNQASAAHLEARIDDLTQLLNRRGFYEKLESSFEHPSVPWSVVMIDLDGFKAVNDTFGHHVGDQLLVAVGSRFAGVLPAQAVFGRLGGDEFAIAVPTSPDLAAALTKAVVETLDEDIVIERQRLKVGASAGVAGWPVHGFTPESVVRSADAAMYSAKRSGNGRNEIAVFDPALFGPGEVVGDRTSATV